MLGVLDPHSSSACTSEGPSPAQEHMPAARRTARQAAYRRRVSRGAPTLQQLLSAPLLSGRQEPSPYASVTVILNHWMRHTLCRQLDSLLFQTMPVAHIWICFFASPMTAAARKAALAYNDSRIAIFESEHNFKYFGRFQLALGAPTRFVLVLDDDMIPGRAFVATLLHVAGTVHGRRAALGSIGWLLPRPQPPPSLQLSSYRSLINDSGGLYLPDLAYDLEVEQMVEVDYLCSLWFVRTAWVRLLFREAPHTFATAEDFHLSHMLRTHAGVRSYVLPIDRTDATRARSGDTDHTLAYNRYSTGGRATIELRDAVWWAGVQGGGTLRWAEEPSTPSPLGRVNAPFGVNALLVVDGREHALALRPLLIEMQSRALATVALALSGGVRGECSEIVPLLGLRAEACTERRLRVLDMKLGRELTWRSNLDRELTWRSNLDRELTRTRDARGEETGAIRASRLLAEATTDLAQMLRTLRPDVVITLVDADAPASRAAMTLDRAGGPPVLALPSTAPSWVVRSVGSLCGSAELGAWGASRLFLNVLVSSAPSALESLYQSVLRAPLAAIAHELGGRPPAHKQAVRALASQQWTPHGVVDVRLLLDVETPEATAKFAREGWSWPPPAKQVRVRIDRGAASECSASRRAVVDRLESWSPTVTERRAEQFEDWMVLLTDEVEISEGLFVYLRHMAHTLALRHGGGAASSPKLLGLALGTPQRRSASDASEPEPARPEEPARGSLAVPSTCGTAYGASAWRQLRRYAAVAAASDADGSNCATVAPASWDSLQRRFMNESGFRMAFSGLHLCRHQGDATIKLASGEEVAAALQSGILR
jgi:hypothetical protein